MVSLEKDAYYYPEIPNLSIKIIMMSLKLQKCIDFDRFKLEKCIA